jgi:hypothetical protein
LKDIDKKIDRSIRRIVPRETLDFLVATISPGFGVFDIVERGSAIWCKDVLESHIRYAVGIIGAIA